jgi:hypothetical protein
MRALIFSLILAPVIVGSAAGAAAAQDYLGLALARDAERIAAEAAARQRDIALTNEVSTLQARVQSEQTLNDITALRARPALPALAYNPKAPAPVIDTSKLASIPDAALADSDARVRAAAANRK